MNRREIVNRRECGLFTLGCVVMMLLECTASVLDWEVGRMGGAAVTGGAAFLWLALLIFIRRRLWRGRRQ